MHHSVKEEIRREVDLAVRAAIRKAVDGPQFDGVSVSIDKIEVFINSPRGGGATVNIYEDGRPIPEEDYWGKNRRAP